MVEMANPSSRSVSVLEIKERFQLLQLHTYKHTYRSSFSHERGSRGHLSLTNAIYHSTTSVAQSLPKEILSTYLSSFSPHPSIPHLLALLLGLLLFSLDGFPVTSCH